MGERNGHESEFIREVWADNLAQEMHYLRELVEDYPYLAMDTEFPGTVARPMGHFLGPGDFHYQYLRCNVDLLKLIQLGITFTDENGMYPPGVCTWQFNFRFDLKEDMYSNGSIDLLINSGLDFDAHARRGIDHAAFAEALISSGFILLPEVKWLSFHGGYDFAYLLKLLVNAPLPNEEEDFFRLLHTFFPAFYDIKYLMKACRALKGGLQEVAETLKLQRVGSQHQAGSDSIVTSMVFFRMRAQFFADHIDDDKYQGCIYQLGGAYAAPNFAATLLPPQSTLERYNHVSMA